MADQPFKSIGQLAARVMAKTTLTSVEAQWTRQKEERKGWNVYYSEKLQALALEHIATVEPTYSIFWYQKGLLRFKVYYAKNDTECPEGSRARAHTLLAERILRTLKLNPDGGV